MCLVGFQRVGNSTSDFHTKTFLEIPLRSKQKRPPGIPKSTPVVPTHRLRVKTRAIDVAAQVSKRSSMALQDSVVPFAVVPAHRLRVKSRATDVVAQVSKRSSMALQDSVVPVVPKRRTRVRT